MLIERVYQMPQMLPNSATEAENVCICVTDLRSEKPFMAIAASQIIDLHLVSKRDIFHYVYGPLYSPEYRERYKENLKRELPRIPPVEPTPPQAATLPKREGEEILERN